MTPDELAAIRERDAEVRLTVKDGVEWWEMRALMRDDVLAVKDRRALLAEVDRLHEELATAMPPAVASGVAESAISGDPANARHIIAVERRRIRAAVEGLRLPFGEDSRLQRYREETLAAVLAAIDDDDPPPGWSRPHATGLA